MIRQLQNKKVIFFDVGYTLDRPASGDWMFTNRFLAEAGSRLKTRTMGTRMRRKTLQSKVVFIPPDSQSTDGARVGTEDAVRRARKTPATRRVQARSWRKTEAALAWEAVLRTGRIFMADLLSGSVR